MTTDDAPAMPATTRIAEIINMSDPYTIRVGEDPMPACVAVLLLGEGRYSIRHENESILPLFLFGGHEA